MPPEYLCCNLQLALLETNVSDPYRYSMNSDPNTSILLNTDPDTACWWIPYGSNPDPDPGFITKFNLQLNPDPDQKPLLEITGKLNSIYEENIKGTVSWDRFEKCWQKLGLRKGRGWFLNFFVAPKIL